MAVKMRLRREGKRKQPFYRVVVADVRSPRDGRFVEDIGYYHPIREPSEISIDHDRALYWLRNGAQPTQAVANLLRIEGIWQEFKPGEEDQDAERRKRRAEKRDKKKAAQEAARKAEAEAQAKVEAEKAAEAAAASDEAAEQAREEVDQPTGDREVAASEEQTAAAVEQQADEAPAETATADEEKAE